MATLIQESVVKKQLKILDFDIENRPLSYIYDGYTSAEITAIAVGWTGSSKIEVKILGVDPYKEMLEWFRGFYDEADVVTGHYVIKHDLPIINGAMLENGLDPLSEKLVHDTKMHLIKKKELSVSQESLSAMFGLPEPKHHMDQPSWREANRLTEDGIKKTKERVTKDVKQHKALRSTLIARNALAPPKLWKPF